MVKLLQMIDFYVLLQQKYNKDKITQFLNVYTLCIGL